MVMGALVFAGCASKEDKTADVTATAPSDSASASGSPSNGATLPVSASTAAPTASAPSSSLSAVDAGGQGAVPDAASTAAAPSGEACPIEPIPAAAAGEVTYDFPVRFSAGGVGAVFTDEAPAALSDAGTQFYLNSLYLFLSNFAFETASGTEVTARPVDADGASLPYGVVFVASNADVHVRLRAPSGEYTALYMDLGAPLGCETGDPTQRQWPLSADNPLYWTWGNAYMLINMQGAVLRPPSTEWQGGLFHLGNLQGVMPRMGSRIRVAADLEPGIARMLELDVGALVNAAVGETGPKNDVDAIIAITEVLDAGEVFTFAP